MKANDPQAMGFGRKATAYAMILVVTASIVLPLWSWHVGPSLRQCGRGRDRGKGPMLVEMVSFALLLEAMFAPTITRFLGVSTPGRWVEVRRWVGRGKSVGAPELIPEINAHGSLGNPPVAVLPSCLFAGSVLFDSLPLAPWGVPFGAVDGVQ